MVYPFPTHIYSHDLLCICLAEYQPSVLCLLSSLKYKVHQLPKLKYFLSHFEDAFAQSIETSILT